MVAIQLLYTLAALIALGAGIPQMAKLIKTKNSDEFSLSTWLMWAGTQSITTLYALSIGDLLFVIVSGSWVLFYGVMVSLIIKYNPRRKTTRSAYPAPVDVARSEPAAEYLR